MFTQVERMMNTILELEANGMDCPNSATVVESELVAMVLMIDDGNDLDYVFSNYLNCQYDNVSSYT